MSKTRLGGARKMLLWLVAGALAVATAAPAFADSHGQNGYEGQPGNQGNGQQGYEGQSGNQGGH